MKREVLAEVNAVTDEAEALPYPAPDQLYRDIHEGAYEPWR
jgi:hypothetical protein